VALLLRTLEPEHASDDASPADPVPPHVHVADDVGGRVHLEILERPGEAVLRGDVRLLALDLPAEEGHGAARRGNRAGDHVEARRLASAVRADEPGDAPGWELQRHAVERGHTAVALGEPVESEDRLAGWHRRRHGRD